MKITDEKLEELIEENRGRICHFARIYQRRLGGAQEADLRQEGYLALLKMVKKGSKRNLKKIISNSLRGMIRDAALRLNGSVEVIRLSQCDGDSEDDVSLVKAEDIPDTSADGEICRIEAESTLERVLDENDVRLARLLMEGLTHEEIARRQGVSRQAVTKKVQKLREKLRDFQRQA